MVLASEMPTLLFPTTRRNVGAIRSVSTGSLYVTGGPESIVTMAVAPALCAMLSAVRCTRAQMSCRIEASKARIVPIITTLSGMMLLRTPPCTAPIVTIAGAAVMST